MVELLHVDFCHIDERGELIQLVHQGYEQVNVLKSKKGVFRGGHFHKKSREAFYVVSGSVNMECTVGNKMTSRIFKEGDFFCIEPYTLHSMRFPEDCVLVALYDRPVEGPDGCKDIYPEEVFNQ